MTARNSKGQFVSPDAAAAERVLERAVEEAIAMLRRGLYREVISTIDGRVVKVVKGIEADHKWTARQALLHAAHAVEPLLRGGAA